MVLDESNYDMHPDIFSTIVIPDFGLLFSGKPDGIQECVTYNPPGPTKPGGFKKVYIYICSSYFINNFSFYLYQMQITLSTENIWAWSLWVHDRNHLVVSDAGIYGSEPIDVVYDMQSLQLRYAVTATETISINEKSDQCLTAKEIEEVNTQECLEIHIDSVLKCTLPWLSKKYPHEEKPLCSHAWEYDQYLANSLKYFDPDSLRNTAKCNPGCKRYEYSTKLKRKGTLRNMEEEDTSQFVQFEFFYEQYEIQVREHVYAYDGLNLFSDFGGWLGLLLGYSILGFYDTLLSILGDVKKKLTQKRHLAKTTPPNSDEMTKTAKAIQVEPSEDDNI